MDGSKWAKRRRAVVLGGSMGGLLAARALSDFFSSVVIVERDELPPDPGPRRGVPQGQHVHALLARGVQVLESLFPGLVDELVSAGVPRARFLQEARFVFSGHQLARADCETSNIQPTRAVLEHAVRARVAALPNVTVIDRCVATGLELADGRITAARVHRATASREERLDADLVVVATGRGGRAGCWLSELGYDPPAEDRVECDVRYVSRLLRIPDDTLPDRMVVVGPRPTRPRVMALAAHGAGDWMLTVGGMAGDRPPVDDPEFLAYTRTIAPPDVFRAIENAASYTRLVAYRFPASVRRRYEQLSRFPSGLLVFGDAICSFNPVYGQGMTVAAIEADALRECLRTGGDHLAHRFFRAAAKVIDPPWQLAGSGDLAIPRVPGPRPNQVRLLNRYVARLHRAASRDPALASAFLRVTGLIDPPSALLRPAVAARVLFGGRHWTA